MSKLDKMTAFITVVEENGFASAARKLGVSTAAISRQITNLEAELQAQLLTRTTRQVGLTQIGTQYFQQCKKILSDLAEADAAILGSHKEATGILNITSPRFFAFEYILPRLAAFQAQNPQLRINLEIAERFPNFATENIDILFGVNLEGPPELVRKRIRTMRYVLSAAPSYLKQYGNPTTPAMLSQHRYITHSMRKPLDLLIFKDGKEIYVEPMLWLNDTRAMRECAINGMGIVKLCDYEIADALQDKRLIEILPEYQVPEYPVYLYYQQSRYLQPKIRRFIDFYLP